MALGEAPPAPKERRVYFEVFGCQMNKLDAELMLETLLDAGYTLTHDPDEASVVLYNTCSIREHAEERVYSRLGALKRRKEREPELVIGLLGCIAQHHGKELNRRLPHVDMVVGTREFHRLPELIAEVRGSTRTLVATELDSPFQFHRRRNLNPNPFMAYVSVMRGCDQVCTYCIVPKTRGVEVSRPPEVILDECRRLADSGVREVMLLGQTVNSYGKRLDKGIGLHTLLYGLEDIDGIERVRFITSHPRFMRRDLIEAMAECKKCCEYLHLPVQSGSNEVLRRMKRTYTRDWYLDRVARLRDAIPGLALATDFIVGFPGENDAEFEESVSLIREARFSQGFVFKYSPRPGTVAHGMSDDIPESVKKERNAVLLAELKKISEEEQLTFIGKRVEILVEGPSRSDPTRFMGRSRDHRIVVFPAPPDEPRGVFAEIEIENATALTLQGRKVSREAQAARV